MRSIIVEGTIHLRSNHKFVRLNGVSGVTLISLVDMTVETVVSQVNPITNIVTDKSMRSVLSFLLFKFLIASEIEVVIAGRRETPPTDLTFPRNSEPKESARVTRIMT